MAQRHGFLEDEPEPLKPEDEWWTAAAREPSGLLARVDPRRGRGFEVHAAVRVAAEDAEGRLRLARYVLRPPFAEAQLERREGEHERVRLTFRTPTRTGQRFLDLHPMALMRRLAWLVPPPRQHPIRYAGVLAPAARLRPAIVPAGRVGVQKVWFAGRAFVPAEPIAYKQSWARLLARVYEVDGQQDSSVPSVPAALTPVGAVLPPHAARWLASHRIAPLLPTGPPAQLCLPFAS